MRGSLVAGARAARLGLTCIGVGLAVSLGGCGVSVPNIQESGFSEKGGEILEAAIVGSVHCELRNAVVDVFVEDASQASQPKSLVEFLRGWSVLMTLTLTMDEKTTLNPNIFASFLPGLFTLGATASASTHATRVDKLTYYYSIHDLVKSGKCKNDYWTNRDNWQTDPQKTPRKEAEEREARRRDARGIDIDRSDAAQNDATRDTRNGSLLIRSDLKTREWLESQMLNNFLGDFVPTKNGFQHQVTFVLDTSVGVTPGAKFPTITLMPSGSLFTGQRTRTHDLVLTFGPATDDDKSKQQLGAAAQAMFLSSQISSGLRTGLLQVSP